MSLPVTHFIDQALADDRLQDDTEDRRHTSSEPIWICVHFPNMALDIFKPQDIAAFVIIAEVKGRQLVYAASDSASEQGIMPGMPLNAAFALCQPLSVRLRDIDAEMKTLEYLAVRARAFTPKVSLSRSDSLLLEVSKSLRLFGGFDMLYRQVSETFCQNSVISAAPSSVAALLLAQNGQETVVRHKVELRSVLGNLSLVDTELSANIIQQLAKCGLKTLRDLWRLPRSDMARRFGPGVVTFLDKVCGVEADIRKFVTPPIRFFQSIDLPAETEDNKTILVAVEKLLVKARHFLLANGSVTEKMVFKLWHRQKPGAAQDNTSLLIQSSQADSRPQRFLPQFMEKLEHLDVAESVERVSLSIDQIFPLNRKSEDLFGYRNAKVSADNQDWRQLLDILTARLGANMVYGVGVRDDHRPEKAWAYERLNQESRCLDKHQKKQRPTDSKDQLFVPMRPCWLLGKPIRFSTRQKDLHWGSEIERIENGWWDGEDIRRDYYLVDTSLGSRYWLFQDLNGQDNDWYVHGLYG